MHEKATKSHSERFPARLYGETTLHIRCFGSTCTVCTGPLTKYATKEHSAPEGAINRHSPLPHPRLMLKAVGYWITGVGDEKLPAPQELVGVIPADQRARLADYLAAGMTQASYLGLSWCRFGCGIDFELMGSRDLTDGAWVWPEGLAHYVREHLVVLPDEFVTQALSRGTPVVAVQSEERAMQQAENPEESEDYTFWHQWSASRRSPQTLERLRQARRQAETLMAVDAPAVWAKAIESALAKHGISQANCLQKNCGRKALAGTYLCAEHYLGKPSADPLHRMGEAFHEILGEFSRGLGLTPDFSIHMPSTSPKKAISFRSLITRLFKRL
jgi:hypothetical protein